MSLKGKVAIVTGGNSGIGKAIALALARAGANIVIDYVVHPEATEALEREIAALGDTAIGVVQCARLVTSVANERPGSGSSASRVSARHQPDGRCVGRQGDG